MKKILSIKDLLWAFCIVICLFALFIGLCFAAFSPYYGDGSGTKTLDFSKLYIVDEGTAQEVPTGAVSIGTVKTLGQTSDAGESYLNGLTFLVDSTLIGMRDMNVVSGAVWGSESGSLPMNTTGTWNIVYSDGSKVSPASAAMISKPAALVIAVGSDGLADCSKESFISGYEAIINGIRQMSPDTVIICCSVAPVTSSYSGFDGLSSGLIASANEWIMQVCINTGTYFCDTAASVSSDSTLMSDYATADGKTLNIGGIQQFLSYLRTHSISY